MLLRIGLLILALWILFFAAVAIVIHETGLLIVDVQNKHTGDRIWVPVPLMLVSAAMDFLPRSPLQKIRMQIELRQEILRAVSKELADCPDSTFLEMHSPQESLSIVIRDGNVLIDANSPEKKVHIRVPITATGETLAKIAGNGPI